ncbi:MAG: MBL fold metallo-hydrolase [Planctomycetota bacterium]|nr:MAG: MBL fold metallo-hydrolase [Planctomycetota bacterium]
MKLLLLGCGALALGFAAADVPQDDLSAVQIRTTLVAGSVRMLEGAGGNIGVSSGPDGTLMIDDQFAPLADKIRKALAEIGGGPLRFLINTHWHGDHTGGNAAFGKQAAILAHENVRVRLAAPQQRRGQEVPAAPKEALPVITYADGVTLHFNGEDVRVRFLPGHTDGDSVILFTGSKVAHLGDLFFSGRFPFVDRNSGGDVQALTRSIDTLLQTIPPDYKLIPGHGPVSTLDDLRSYHRMLTETTELVRQRIRDGMSREQVTAAGVPEPWSAWSWQFIDTPAWLGTVYDCLDK